MKRLFTLAIVAMIASLTFAQAPVQKKAAVKSQIEKVASNAQMQKALEAKAAMTAKVQTAQETSGSVLRKAAPTAHAAKAMQMQAPRTLTTLAAQKVAARSVRQFKNPAETSMMTRMNKGLMGRKSFAPAKAPVADGDFAIMNVATGMYLNGSNAWGTRASITKHGQFMTLAETAEGKYNIDSHISNGGDSHFLGTNGYVDAAAAAYDFVEVASGVYAIKNDETFLTANADNTVDFAAEAGEASQWVLLSKADVLAATSSTGLVDFTALIPDADFSRNNQDFNKWEGESKMGKGGPNAASDATARGMNAEKWGGNSTSIDFHYTLTDLPNGTYTVKFQGFYRYNNTADNTNDVAAATHADGTEKILSNFYANEVKVPFMSIADTTAVAIYGKMPFSQAEASEAFTKGAYQNELEVEVTDGTLTLKVEKLEADHEGCDWTILDNIELYYQKANPEENPYAEVDLDLVANEFSANYYASDGDWFCVLQAQGIPFRFDIVTNDPTPLNGTYTWDQMDHDYSWAGTQSQGWEYTDAIFTVNAEGTEVEAYVTLSSGEKVRITYTKPETPEITAYQTYEFSAEQTVLNDLTSQGLMQIMGDNGDQFASIALYADQVAGTYTIDDMYGAYTNLYLTADDYEGVKPFALNATVTEDGATVIYDAYNGTEYTLIFHFKEEGGNDDNSEVVVTKDANGIITSVTGGESKAYTRSAEGGCYFVSGQQIAIGAQSGTVTVIEDGDKVYIKDPVARYTNGSWVEGSKVGNTIVVPAKQPLYYSASYATTISLRWASVSASGSIAANDALGESFVYDVTDNTWTLQGTSAWDGASDAPFMGAMWDDDNSFAGGEYETVLTYDPEYVAPSTDLVELPDSAEVEAWTMNATSVSSSSSTPIMNQAVNISFVGNDVYLQGVFSEFPTAWIKGTKSGSTVTFSKLQYIGNYGGSYDMYFIGTDGEGITDATATLSADAKTLTFTESLLANAATDRIYYLTWLDDVVISAEPAEEPVITDLTAELPYANGFDTEAEQAEAAIYDANFDGKTFTFADDTKTGSTTARYAYNTNAAGDDYVVFPGFTMEAGKSYKVSVDARSYSANYPERLEIVAGTVAKASELTIPVLEPTDIASGDYATLTADFTPEADGVYYIAIHGISDADQFYLYTDNFSVKENNMNAPAAPANLQVIPDSTAALSADIVFNAPATTLGGDSITEPMTVVIKRDGEVISDSIAVAAGELVKYTDAAVPAPGQITYTVYAVVGELTSDAAKATVYVGEDIPDDVLNLVAVDKDGKVGLTWDAPADGVNGGIIIAENLKYNVYPVEMVDFWGMTFPEIDFGNPYATELTATNYDVEYNTNEGEQAYTYFGVTAANTAGESTGAMGAVLTGAPYELPVVEEFTGGSLSYWWGVDYDDNIYNANGGLGLSQDGEIVFQAPVAGWIELYSGKIALNGADKPQMSFEYSGAGSMIATVYGPNKSKEVTLTPAADYQTATIDLAELASEPWVRLTLHADFAEAGEAYFDNFIVMNAVENDLEVAVVAPKSLVAGSESTVKVTVTNKGTKEAAGYTVNFYVNDELVDSTTDPEEVPALKFFESTTIEYGIETTVFNEAGDITVKAEVIFADDVNEANNTDEAVVTIVAPSATPVETVAAAENEDGTVKIDWTVAEVTAQETTEDFESYEAGSIYADGATMGPWAAKDGDQGMTYGWNSSSIMWDYTGELYAFAVMNFPTVFGAATDIEAASGDQALMFMSVTDDEGNGFAADDWFISPELPGMAQTISFKACPMTANYGAETVEVMASTDGQTWTKVASYDIEEENTWKECTANLAEGTKYFALHYVSNDVFALFIDDVTYTVGGAAATGFNIYVDEELVGTADAEARTYTATNVPTGAHKFSVTAVYGEKESAPVSADLTTAIYSVAGTQAATEAYTISGIRMDAKNLKRGVYVINGKKVVK